MYKKFWPVSMLISLFGLACNPNVEVNTVDPQASPSIKSSKADRFFVCELEKGKSLEHIFETSEIWIEHVWKYRLDRGTEYKEKQPGLQLVMKVVDFKDGRFQEKDFMINWDIKREGDGFIGRSHDMFVLLLKDNTIPPIFTFQARRLRNNTPVDSVTFNISPYCR